VLKACNGLGVTRNEGRRDKCFGVKYRRLFLRASCAAAAVATGLKPLLEPASQQGLFDIVLGKPGATRDKI